MSQNTTRPSAWAIMRPVQGRIRRAMAWSAIASATALGAMAALAWAMHALLQTSRQYPWQPLLVCLLLTALAFTLRLRAAHISHCAAFRLEALLRTTLAGHLAQVPLGQVQQLGSAALSKVLMEDVKALHVFVADATPLYARAYAAPLLTGVLLYALDWRLALAATAVLGIGMTTVALAWRGSAQMMRRYHEAGERVAGAVVEYVQAMPVVRSFDTGATTFGRYQRALEDYRAVLLRWYRMAGLPSRLSQIILSPLPTLAALLWLGAWLLVQGRLDAAHWLAALLIGTGMAEALMPLMALRHLIGKTHMSIQRIHEILQLPPLPLPAPGQAQTPRDASVVFEQVDFRYGDDGPLTLQGVGFRAPPGSVTALVGPSGAGKSTVAQLIPRFWDVSAGRILVGGVDVRHMQPDALMRQVGFVFQDVFLLADTIANNIRLGVPEATMEEVIAAARCAQAHAFIEALPQGYDTQAGERGVHLSGGQRQRIAIARAILQNRPILVLDEATAYADAENEAAIVAALAQLMHGKTVLMVAHRLPTIRTADQILVFQQGRLAEQGRHDTLLAQGGLYARLWRNHEQARDWALSGSHAASHASRRQGEQA